MSELLAKGVREFREGSIVKGHILEVRPREVLVDIGYKSEGVISLNEFEDGDEPQVGDEVEVLLVRLENYKGMVILSKERAAYRQNWEKIRKVFQEGGIIKGKVKAAVKGGLTVNIGVEAAVRQSWDAIIGSDGVFVGMNSFGASAPYKELYKKFGITAEAIAGAALSKLGKM